MKDCVDFFNDSCKIRHIFEAGNRQPAFFESRRIRSKSYRKKCPECGQMFGTKFELKNCTDHKHYEGHDF